MALTRPVEITGHYLFPTYPSGTSAVCELVARSAFANTIQWQPVPMAFTWRRAG